MVWKIFVKFVGFFLEYILVVFEDVIIYRVIIFLKIGLVILIVYFMLVFNKFNVFEGDSLVVFGKIFMLELFVLSEDFKVDFLFEEEVYLIVDCIYREFRLCGYDYGFIF